MDNNNDLSNFIRKSGSEDAKKAHVHVEIKKEKGKRGKQGTIEFVDMNIVMVEIPECTRNEINIGTFLIEAVSYYQ